MFAFLVILSVVALLSLTAFCASGFERTLFALSATAFPVFVCFAGVSLDNGSLASQFTRFVFTV